MPRTKFAGQFNAFNYAYGINPDAPAFEVIAGASAAGVYSVTLGLGVVYTADGQPVSPATGIPITIGSGINAETVTPSAVSNPTPTAYGTCIITANYGFGHGQGDLVRSGDCGLQEAATAALAYGGGVVIVDAKWYAAGGTAAILATATALLPANVSIEDNHGGSTGDAVFSVNVTSATPTTTRALVGQITEDYAGSVTTTGSIVGVRGLATIAAGTTQAGNSFVYGTQGKLVIAGTVNGSDWVAGVVGQLDLSTATLTAASHVTPIWSDAGATGPSVSSAFADSLVLTNTTATTFNSLIYGYSKAAFAFDLTDNGGGFIVGTTASTASGCLKVKINGATKYIQLYTTEA